MYLLIQSYSWDSLCAYFFNIVSIINGILLLIVIRTIDFPHPDFICLRKMG